MAQAPVARGYEQQVRPGRTAPLPDGASGDAFGASIGAAIGQTGGRLFEQAKSERALDLQQRRATEAADAGVQFAELSGRLDSDVQTMRSEAASAAAAHGDNVAAKVDGARDEFLQRITNDQVRDTYRDRFASMGANLVARERGWEVEQRVKYQVDGLDRAGTAQANRVATDRSPETLEQAMGDVAALRVGLANVPDDTADAALRGQQRKVAVSWFNAMNQNGGHDQVLAVLQAGRMNQYLEPEDIANIRSGAQVEVRRAEAARQAVDAQQKEQARQGLSLLRARVSAGDQPTDAEFAAAQETARRYGFTTEQFNLGVMHDQVLTNRETRDWTPGQFDAAINGLESKGDRRSPAENVRLAHLREIRGSRVTEFNNDPQGHAARMGNGAPPLDLAAPTRAAIDQRVAWAEGYARANGMAAPPYLSNAEMEQLRQRAGPNLPGQLDVARYLGETFGSARGYLIAQQLAPENRTFQLAAQMLPASAQLMARGVGALQRDREHFYQTGTGAGSGMFGLAQRALRITGDDAHRIFRQVEGVFPQDLRDAVLTSALNIAAGMADQSGAPGVSEGGFRMAIHRAAGAMVRDGRVVSGGLHLRNGMSLWLPSNLSAEEFDRRIDRMALPMSVIGVPQVDAVAAPPIHFGGGRQLTVEQWRQVQWQTVEQGVYRARWPRTGGLLLGPNGQPFILDMRDGQ